jgi:hypothetical protein
MNKYKLLGVTEYAERHLSVDDIDELKSMIGCVIEESDEPSIVDGKRMFIMIDGEETHIDYLELEMLQPEIEFEKQT